MSLYTLLFGVDDAAPVLLAALGLTRGDVPRFRDCYLDGDHIVIHTRTGGGNRDAYEEGNAALAAHPCYLRDADDDFDSTYADFTFRFPEEYAAELQALSTLRPPDRPSEKWQRLLAGLKKEGAS